MTATTNSHRALIVIDVQNEYDGGNMPIEYPPFGDTVANVAGAMHFAAGEGIRIVVVRQLAPETSPIFAAGSHGSALHPLVAGHPRDYLVDKKLPSAFAGTGLEAWLRAEGVTTLTIVGYMTHNCDLATAIDATQLGFQVELISDATGSLPYANRAGSATAEEIHRVMLVVMQSRFAGVGTLAEWRQAAANGRHLAIEGVHASNLAARTQSRAA